MVMTVKLKPHDQIRRQDVGFPYTFFFAQQQFFRPST